MRALSKASAVRNPKVVATLLLIVALQGCTLQEVAIPDFSGPSELAISLRLTAVPDILIADDGLENESQVRATLRDHNGRAVPGRAIFFTIENEAGVDAAIGSLNNKYAATDSSGVAEVLYYPPARLDATANQFVNIAARPIGDDAYGHVYRRVRIEIRSPESRLFPPNPGNDAPTCNFAIQPVTGPNSDGSYPIGFQILFQSTSFDVPPGFIVRYEWNFGDGTPHQFKPDVNHAYFTAGTFTVTHIVTDNNGVQAACAADIVVH